MRLWPPSDEADTGGSTSAARDAKRVCETLGIPHETLDLSDYAQSAFERELTRLNRATVLLRRTGAQMSSWC